VCTVVERHPDTSLRTYPRHWWARFNTEFTALEAVAHGGRERDSCLTDRASSDGSGCPVTTTHHAYLILGIPARRRIVGACGAARDVTEA
jgi:hypothetical protein